MSRTRSRPPGRGRCVSGCVRVVYYSVLIKFVLGPDTVRDSRERVPVPLDPPTRAGPQANTRNRILLTSALFTHQRQHARLLRAGGTRGDAVIVMTSSGLPSELLFNDGPEARATPTSSSSPSGLPRRFLPRSQAPRTPLTLHGQH